MQNQTPDCVFSFDFLPEVSLVCSKEKIPYVSWTVNMPAAGLFSDLAKDPVNRLFAIDSALCETLKGSGVKVTYLPPAADPDLRQRGNDGKAYRHHDDDHRWDHQHRGEAEDLRDIQK